MWACHGWRWWFVSPVSGVVEAHNDDRCNEWAGQWWCIQEKQWGKPLGFLIFKGWSGEMIQIMIFDHPLSTDQRTNNPDQRLIMIIWILSQIQKACFFFSLQKIMIKQKFQAKTEMSWAHGWGQQSWFGSVMGFPQERVISIRIHQGLSINGGTPSSLDDFFDGFSPIFLRGWFRGTPTYGSPTWRFWIGCIQTWCWCYRNRQNSMWVRNLKAVMLSKVSAKAYAFEPCS